MKTHLWLMGLVALLLLPVSFAAPIGDGLALCFSADELVVNQNTVPSSFNLTSAGTPGTRTGKVGALAYDAPDNDNTNYRYVANNSQVPNGSLSRTICTWHVVDTTEAASNQFFYSYGKATADALFAPFVGVSGSSNPLTFSDGDTDTPLGQTTTNGTWYHTCFSYNQTSGNLSSYVNGVPKWGTIITLATGPRAFYLGQYVGAASFGEFDGGIDEIMIFNTTLTQAEINGIYNGGTGTSCAAVYANSTNPNINTITLSLYNLVNSSLHPRNVTLSNITGVINFTFFNITANDFCVSYTGNGTGVNCSTPSFTEPVIYFNASNNSVSVVGGSQLVTAKTYQALINVNAYKLLLNTTIDTFNGTNNQVFNSTVVGNLTVPSLNGTNYIIIGVLGNYTINATCVVPQPLQTVQCNATGVHDNRFTIGANYQGAGISAFNVSVNSAAFGGDLYSRQTTNGSLVFNLLQSYAYNFTLRSSGYTTRNATLGANASTNLHNFSLLLSRQVTFRFRDEITRALINNTNMTLEVISDLYATNLTTTNGTLVNVLSFPQEYTFRYRGGNYTERQYFLNVTDDTNDNLTLYVIDLAEAELVSVTVSDTGANLLEGATVKLLRYFLYCNCYEVVEMERTSFEGVTSLWAQPLEGHYKWSVDYNGVNYFISTSPETITVDSKFFSIDLGTGYYTSYQGLSNVGTAIVLNTTSGSLSYTWSDPTGGVSSACITTYRYIGLVETQYSQACGTSSVGGVLTSINVSDGRRYKYIASLNMSSAYGYQIIATGFYDPAYAYDFGDQGAWLSVVVLIVVALIFSYSAVAILIASALVVIVVGALGFMTFTTSFIAGIVAVIIGMVVFLIRS